MHFYIVYNSLTCILLHLLGRFIKPFATSGKIFISCWLFVAIVITATYSANLIAFLSVEKYRVPFNNLAQLASQEEYKFGTLGGTAQMLHVKVRRGSVRVIYGLL